MMLGTGCSCSGCLTLIISFFLFMFLLKFGFIIFIVLLIMLVLYKNSDILNKIKKYFAKNTEYTVKPGEVYKECSYCQKKAKRNANFCDNCGRPFE